jgi:hypothetical protein
LFIYFPVSHIPELITIPILQFVYPFTLEPHVLTLEQSWQSTLNAQDAHRDAVLHAREEEKIRRKREALRRVAPGFEPESGMLLPTQVGRTGSSLPSNLPAAIPSNVGAVSQGSQGKSVMDDLVDRLALLDSASSSPSPKN